mmetsp:Transcript_96876/g.202409  ORF Transcript_96876/g.202409 Transcript_96876/m.202409 type:complete len:245 (+) Transcript_96876:332-1066(+)
MQALLCLPAVPSILAGREVSVVPVHLHLVCVFTCASRCPPSRASERSCCGGSQGSASDRRTCCALPTFACAEANPTPSSCADIHWFASHCAPSPAPASASPGIGPLGASGAAEGPSSGCRGPRPSSRSSCCTSARARLQAIPLHSPLLACKSCSGRGKSSGSSTSNTCKGSSSTSTNSTSNNNNNNNSHCDDGDGSRRQRRSICNVSDPGCELLRCERSIHRRGQQQQQGHSRGAWRSSATTGG